MAIQRQRVNNRLKPGAIYFDNSTRSCVKFVDFAGSNNKVAFVSDIGGGVRTIALHALYIASSDEITAFRVLSNAHDDSVAP